MAVDLDARRAEREAAAREAGKEGPTVTFGGKTYHLPVELPYEVIEALRGLNDEDKAIGAMAELVEGLLASGQLDESDKPAEGEGDEPEEPVDVYAEWLEAKMTFDDMGELVKGVMEEYGITAPLP